MDRIGIRVEWSSQGWCGILRVFRIDWFEAVAEEVLELHTIRAIISSIHGSSGRLQEAPGCSGMLRDALSACAY